MTSMRSTPLPPTYEIDCRPHLQQRIIGRFNTLNPGNRVIDDTLLLLRVVRQHSPNLHRTQLDGLPNLRSVHRCIIHHISFLRKLSHDAKRDTLLCYTLLELFVEKVRALVFDRCFIKKVFTNSWNDAIAGVSTFTFRADKFHRIDRIESVSRQTRRRRHECQSGGICAEERFNGRWRQCSRR